MQHEPLVSILTSKSIFGVVRDLDMWSHSKDELSRSYHISLDAARRDKHDGTGIIALALKMRKLSAEKYGEQILDFGPWGLKY